MTGDFDLPNLPPKENNLSINPGFHPEPRPCPSCGHCPTCGRVPTYPGYYGPTPYWSGLPVSTTFGADVTFKATSGFMQETK